MGFVNIDHLVKTCAQAFPDSLIAQELSMGRTSASYHLRLGLAKREADKVFADISTVPFSLSLATTKLIPPKLYFILTRHSIETNGSTIIANQLLKYKDPLLRSTK